MCYNVHMSYSVEICDSNTTGVLVKVLATGLELADAIDLVSRSEGLLQPETTQDLRIWDEDELDWISSRSA